MNPEQISIPDCTLDNPVKNSSGKISFCLLPCLYKDERLQVKLPTRFKIYSHPGNGNGNDSFSLGISIPENSLEFFRDLEKHLNALAMKKTKEVEKIGRSFARYDQGDFSLLKADKSGSAEMLKQSPVLWMRFWWRKLFNQFQLLMTLRIGMSQIWRVMRTFKKTFSTEKVFTQRFSAISFDSRCKTRSRKYAQGMEKIS